MKKCYLISLVSFQTIPNILFIKEMKNVDYYIFLFTEQSLEYLPLILDTTGIEENKIIKSQVAAVDIQGVLGALEDLEILEVVRKGK